ncbi:CU044_5270 family protein [Nonomuraea longicatena]|uniref:CU044_5270 family protein n=1 Tax=Nonomuraea longicatena TaxID=83682 RepID=A0ABN1NRG5_9ACTN
MNPLDELRAARPAHLGETAPADARTRTDELAYAMAQEREGRSRPKTRVWGLSLLGAAAAATAITLVGTDLVGGTAPRAPTPPVASAEKTPGGTAVTTLSAQQVLLAAAEKAEKEPETSGKYWHVRTEQRNLVVTDGGYVMEHRSFGEQWTTENGVWGHMQSLGTRPVSDEDQRAWEAAGSPKMVRIPIPGRPGDAKLLDVPPGKPLTGHEKGKEIFWLGRNVTMADLRKLPEDADKLRAWLLPYFDSPQNDVPGNKDEWLFEVTSGLITAMPVSPEVRGAAFRMLADLPSVDTVGEVTDAAGRTGSAVAMRVRTADGEFQQRLLIDTDTGRALARESVVIDRKGLEPGTVSSSETVTEAGWTDSRKG